MDDKKSGFLHVWFLYGFFILSIGHIEVVLNGLTKFMLNFGKEPFLYKNITIAPSFLIHFYEFSQDFMAFFVVIMISIALYRRLSGKVKRLKRSIDAEMILYLIGGLYITFFWHNKHSGFI